MKPEIPAHYIRYAAAPQEILRLARERDEKRKQLGLEVEQKARHKNQRRKGASALQRLLARLLS